MSLLAALLNAPALDDDAFLAQLRAKLAATEPPATEPPATEPPTTEPPAFVPTGAPPSAPLAPAFVPSGAPSSTTPETITLATIPLMLSERDDATHSEDLEAVSRDVDTSNRETTDDLETAVSYAWQREFSDFGRVRRALGAFAKLATWPERIATICPVCSAQLVIAVPPAHDAPAWFEVRGACVAGCAADEIATAIATRVDAHETAEASRSVSTLAEALDDLRAQFEAEMSPIANAPAPVTWVIPGVVPDRALSLLIGKSGDRKTWELEHQAVCIALGIDWLGRPVERRRALLCLLESHAINRARVDFIVRGLGRDPSELVGWLYYWAPNKDLKSDSETGMADLGQRVERLGLGFIGIDSLSKLGSSQSANAENDAVLVGLKLEPLAQLAQLGIVNGRKVTDTPPAIVILHHAGQSGNSRGSTAVEQHADFVSEIRAARPKDNDSPLTLSRAAGSRISWVDEKIRFRLRGDSCKGEPVVPELVTATDDDNVRDRDPVPPLRPVQSTTERRARLLELMREMGPTKWTPLRNALGGDPKTAADIRDALKTGGVVMCRDYLWQLVDGGAQ